MPKAEGRFWTISKAIGTLAGSVATAVVAALLIHHFTSPPVFPQIGLTGVVSNAATRQPIVDAQVTAASEATIASVKTDSEGRYSFVLAGTASGKQSVAVDVLAGGFAFYRSAPLTVSTGDNYVALWLSSTATAASGMPAQPGPSPSPGPTSSLSRFQPQVLRGLPANFSKPRTTAQLITTSAR